MRKREPVGGKSNRRSAAGLGFAGKSRELGEAPAPTSTTGKPNWVDR